MRKFKRRHEKFEHDEPLKVSEMVQPAVSPVLQKSKIEKGLISKFDSLFLILYFLKLNFDM